MTTLCCLLLYTLLFQELLRLALESPETLQVVTEQVSYDDYMGKIHYLLYIRTFPSAIQSLSLCTCSHCSKIIAQHVNQVSLQIMHVC